MKIPIEHIHYIAIDCDGNKIFYHVRDNICKNCLVKSRCLDIKSYTYPKFTGGTIFTSTPCNKMISDYKKFNKNILKQTTLVWS